MEQVGLEERRASHKNRAETPEVITKWEHLRPQEPQPPPDMSEKLFPEVNDEESLVLLNN